ncbi:DUF1330-domain-containing protein [Cryphonectria parasitica EP155]|uniref:DUF1330-domain-containing protein n=1 Tax=Cryphonectria parasitica (strain ATCC 38755 / EP155) TaxID=660469 RepID=A0A9P4YCS4_CRYP1|nr:DUF1330-domain-containing protein [Cryphonectria parasitica EP155]KAF3770986.1 DUF1330-domain-containing protein [Cryphonectria parasitica EP155]
MTVYAVVLLKIHDRERYQIYQDGVMPSITKNGGKIVAFDEDPKVIEGDWPYNRSLVLSFPSAEDLNNWYTAPEYQALVPHRWQASTGQLAVLRSFE